MASAEVADEDDGFAGGIDEVEQDGDFVLNCEGAPQPKRSRPTWPQRRASYCYRPLQRAAQLSENTPQGPVTLDEVLDWAASSVDRIQREDRRSINTHLPH
jgi:hypothetical protein